MFVYNFISKFSLLVFFLMPFKTYSILPSPSLFTVPRLFIALAGAQVVTNKIKDGEPKKKECTFPGLAGTFPIKFLYIFNQLKEVQVAQEAGTDLPQGLNNRLLIHGAPGNGKTRIACTLAEKAGCHLVFIKCPEIMDKYMGRSAKKIKKIFKNMRERADIDKKIVLLVIDEIDVIAAHTESEQRTEHKAALQELWSQLDDIQDDPRFFVICTTNVENLLNEAFKTRFGNNIVEISAPDEIKRREVLQLYMKKCTGKAWDPFLLEKLVKASDDPKICVRLLKDYVQEILQVAKNENNGVITEKMALDVFNEMKAKYVADLIKWAESFATRENYRDVVQAIGLLRIITG